MSEFESAMLKSKLILDRADEYLSVNTDSAPTSARLVRDMAIAMRGLRSLQYPEMQQLEPIAFGPNDEDRVKDMFEKVFLLEYGYSRDKDDGDSYDACRHAQNTAIEVTDIYRRWLKEQKAES